MSNVRRSKRVWLFAAALALLVIVVVSHAQAKLIEDCCCDSESVDVGNDVVLQNQLVNLRHEKFFKIFKADLYSDCPFWKDDQHCSRKSCAVCGFCSPDEIPQSWQSEIGSETTSPVDRTLWPGFKGWREDDTAFWVAPGDQSKMSYIDMDLNPEGYTGYEGEEPWRIWRAIYEENCFPGGSHAQCTEERVFYRIFSGLHAAIACHISDNYPVDPTNIYDDTNVQSNPEQFARRVGNHPDRINNLYFAFVFMLRALNKAAPLLSQYSYDTGNVTADRHVRVLMNDILTSRLVTSCVPEQSFDESALFGKATAPMKAQFKAHFRNVSRIMDCVGCEKCRLHGKLQVLGIGTALKILFNDAPLTAGDLQRNEIVALMTTIAKFSNALRVVHHMKYLQARRLVVVGAAIGASLLLVMMIVVARIRRRRRAAFAAAADAAEADALALALSQAPKKLPSSTAASSNKKKNINSSTTSNGEHTNGNSNSNRRRKKT